MLENTPPDPSEPVGRPTTTAGKGKRLKFLASILVSGGLLAAILTLVDIRAVGAAFEAGHAWLIVLALTMAIPQTLISAYRFKLLAPESTPIGLFESMRLFLAGSTLNMVLPSKMGDLARAWFLHRSGRIPGSLALSLLVFERICDLLSLMLWGVLGLLFLPEKNALFWALAAAIVVGVVGGGTVLASPSLARWVFGLVGPRLPGKVGSKVVSLGQGWDRMQALLKRDRVKESAIYGLSILLWLLHLLQIWLFIFALRQSVPMLPAFGLTALSILAGLLPLTFAGVGTRDAAVILLFAPYFDAATAAALGLLLTSRYVVVGLAGLPFCGRYLAGPARPGVEPGPPSSPPLPTAGTPSEGRP